VEKGKPGTGEDDGADKPVRQSQRMPAGTSLRNSRTDGTEGLSSENHGRLSHGSHATVRVLSQAGDEDTVASDQRTRGWRPTSGRGRPAPRRLPACRVRSRDLAVHGAAPARCGAEYPEAEYPEAGIQDEQRPLELPFCNTSSQDFTTIASDASAVAKNLRDYISGFSGNVRKITDRFGLDSQITRLAEAKLLYRVVGRFAAMRDLDKLSTDDMGYVFEHLIRRFYEDASAEAGDHFTPREVIDLMVNVLIAPDMDTIAGAGQVISILDPACGTGGMLTSAEDRIRSINPNARVLLFGQEFNAESWATCESEMLLRGQPGSIVFGNSLGMDGHCDRKFDYLLANPPFGVEWKKVKEEVEAEAALGHAGRFGAGLPRISDGSFLFLQHMIAKMRPAGEGERGWRSSSAARPCSPAAPGRVSPGSGGGSWRTTGWRASSPCRTRCSTTRGSRRTSGSCPAGRCRRSAAR